GQLLAPLESRTREVPGGGVHEAGEPRRRGAGGHGGRRSRQARLELACERVYRLAGGEAVELLAPPLQARVGDVMIEPRLEGRADLPLDAAERGQHRLLGGRGVEPG